MVGALLLRRTAVQQHRPTILIRTRLGWFEWLQADLVSNVVKLFVADIFKLFAARFEFFVNLYGFFGHYRVGFLGAADEREIRAGGESFMAIGIQSDTQHYRFAFPFATGVRHEFRLKAVHRPVKSWRFPGPDAICPAAWPPRFSICLFAF